MKWKPYPSYKDSGLEWLGEIPVSWEVNQLKRTFAILNGSTPRTTEPEYWDGDIPWATPEDLGNLSDDVLKTTRRAITRKGYESCGTSIAPIGSLVLSTRAPIGHLARAGVPLCTNQGCRCLVFRTRDRSGFFYYQLRAARQELESLGEGSTFKELPRDRLSSMRLATPRASEQRAIAGFLDRETGRIDALIEKKERQIELLKEKRAALISHAVTKGLDPNVKMKDSGIEWLGRIPAHWEISRAKMIFREINRRSTTGEEELLTVSHITGVTPRSEKDVTMFMAQSLEDYKKCEPGDLVVNTMWAWMGAMGFALQAGIVSPSYNVYRFRGDSDVSEYYDHLFRTSRFISEVVCYSKGIWTSRLRLYPEAFFEIRIPRPPTREQDAIASYINDQTGEYGRIQVGIERSISLLREYRSALITAAVTGKLDVREEVGE